MKDFTIKLHFKVTAMVICTLLQLLFFCSRSSIAQQIEQINLPTTNGGNMPYEIMYANNKIFVYCGGSIVVYNTSDNSYNGKITLTAEDYGKFNPIYFDP